MYRKDIFEAQGIEVPKTYDEMLTIAEAFAEMSPRRMKCA